MKQKRGVKDSRNTAYHRPAQAVTSNPATDRGSARAVSTELRQVSLRGAAASATPAQRKIAPVDHTAEVHGVPHNCHCCGRSLEIAFSIRQLLHMDIDLTGFSATQQRALVDLLILAMYADGQLTTVEDKQLQKLLTALGHTEEFDRQRESDAAVTRMRPFLQSIEQAKEQALLLAEAFTTRTEQKQVYAAVQEIMTTDKHVSSWEGTLLSELGLKCRM
jgi:hypothetical protein